MSEVKRSVRNPCTVSPGRRSVRQRTDRSRTWAAASGSPVPAARAPIGAAAAGSAIPKVTATTRPTPPITLRRAVDRCAAHASPSVREGDILADATVPARTRAPIRTGRWRWESNPRTGLCRPLPEPLGYATGNARGYPARVRSLALVSGAVGGHAHATRRVAAACLVAMLAVAVTDTAAGARHRRARSDGAPGGDRTVRLADVGLLPGADVRHALPDEGHRRDRASSPSALVPSTARRGHRDPGARRRRRSTSATGPDACSRSRRATGRRRWTFRAPTHPQVYSGQIVASAAVADVARRAARSSSRPATRCTRCGRRTARRSGATGSAAGRRDDPTEIESSPVVVDGKVDLRLGRAQRSGKGGRPAGVVALDARTGRERWTLVTAPVRPRGPERRPAPGAATCGAPPRSTATRGLVIVGTGNCADAAGLGPRSATRCVAVDLDDRRTCAGPTSRTRRTATTSTSPARRTSSTSTAARSSGSATRTGRTTSSTARPARRSRPSTPPSPASNRPGGNFSTGGFIGPAAYARRHRRRRHRGRTGAVPARHRRPRPARSRGRTTSRARPTPRPRSPATSRSSAAPTSRCAPSRCDDRHGALVAPDEGRGLRRRGRSTRDDVYAVAGIREPGLDKRSRTSGVYRFSLHGKACRIRIHSRRPTHVDHRAAAAEPQRVRRLAVRTRRSTLKKPPAGLTPTATLEITESPFRAPRRRPTGLGPPGRVAPARERRPRPRARPTYARVHVRERRQPDRRARVRARRRRLDAPAPASRAPAPTYNRVTIVAVKDATTMPDASPTASTASSPRPRSTPPLAPRQLSEVLDASNRR